MRNHRPHNPKHFIWSGALFILIGIALLLKQLGVNLPDWLFTWPIIPILVGLFIGFKHSFRHGASFILLLVGGIFLLNENMANPIAIRQFILPGIFILFGVMFIFKRNRIHKCRTRHGRDKETLDMELNADVKNDPADIISISSVFSGTRRQIVSKSFKGGDITTVFGGAEIDFSQADLDKNATLDIMIAFGGIKLTVPRHWDVRNDTTFIAAGVEDKRNFQQSGTPEEGKILTITGTAVFGGLEINSY